MAQSIPRRTFLAASVATAASMLSGAIPEDAPGGSDFYELRIYATKSAKMVQRCGDYFQNALIPALRRAGTGPVGAFSETAKPEGSPIDELYLNILTGQVAHGMQAMIDAGATGKSAVGKPIVLAAKTSDGKEFSTKQYAGKVVLVDFWATWCGPCKAQMPQIKTMYDKYHDKGLEIVGVSCDGDGDALASYTKENNMPWVQLWDREKQAGKTTPIHILANEWKLNGIPQMFLIDRNGVLRSVEAHKEMETLIPKLLDEKVGQ